MTEDAQHRQRNHNRLWLALAALVAILAILIVPPFISVSRYKARITNLISDSLSRPVRLSSVEVRLLPRPGFVLTDLTVQEDSAYGAEPVLHANTVTASIRLLSLWRGRVVIDTISVDEASLNLVRTASGSWNLDSLLRTAAYHAQSVAGNANPGTPVRLPYLEATNSRINIKNGAEKLPFSLLNAEFSLSQQTPGEWRVRLRGQPVRTDLSLQQADTGVLRLDAKLQQSPQLRQMPINLDLEWREAQLGQLTRLLLGVDAGWRGDLTGQLHLEGTAEGAQIKTRLSATGVHRYEFAPVVPMDFDANCTLVAHISTRAIDNLLCDSPLGNGHVRITGNLPAVEPGQGVLPKFSFELDRISVAAGLDALRTVRSDLAPGIDAAGFASGKITYAPVDSASLSPGKPVYPTNAHSAKSQPIVQGPLTGNITIQGFALSGNGLSQPIQIPKLVFVPALAPTTQPSESPLAMTTTGTFPAGGAVPLTFSSRLGLSGYQFTVRGQASIVRTRELAHVAGFTHISALDSLAGEPITMDLTAEGPWMQVQQPTMGNADSITGTVTLRNANWKPAYLANAIQISHATLHLGSDEFLWDPVVFSYGPVKGTAVLSLPATCDASLPCVPHFQLQFGALDASILQAAFLGAQEKGTLLSTLIDRLRSTAVPAWPRLDGTFNADSLVVGPIALIAPTATLSTLADGATITAFDAGLLGGRVHGSGTYQAAASAKDKP
jgi:hypothetical protein